MESISFIAFTRKGCETAKALAAGLAARADYAGARVSVCGPGRLAAGAGIDAYDDLAAWTAEHFAADDALVFVGASGIAVRAIAPHVRDKFVDPAVVSVDEAGSFAVPLLSGHVGGANELARALAGVAGGQAAVSTATDVNGVFAVDEWAARQGFAIIERDVAKEVSAALLEGKPVGFASDFDLGWELPQGVVDGEADIGFVVSLDEGARPFPRTLHLVPRVVTVGVGCKRGTGVDALAAAVFGALSRAHVSPRAVRALASIDVKADEPAIRELARREGWGLEFYSADELAAVPGSFDSSDFVEQTVGVGNVCERAACAGGGSLVAAKQAANGVTVAIAAVTVVPIGENTAATVDPAGVNTAATVDSVGGNAAATVDPVGVNAAAVVDPVGALPERPSTAVDGRSGSAPTNNHARASVCPLGGPAANGRGRASACPASGRLSIVGLGPGGADDMTGRARRAVEEADVVAGYTVYVDLLRSDFPRKRYIVTPMRKEVERCRAALDAAAEGHNVAMVCSGDPGVYGMAGLVLELAGDYPPVQIEVVPGVSAANGGAAVLGAPLMHDYCVISLSDLLTPWEKIERRLVAAAESDLVIALYNPSSHKRPDYLRRACDILLAHKSPATVCGTVRNIGREGEEARVMTLAELRDAQVDMFTTVFVGNSQTMQLGGRMVTPRGYLQREG